MLFEKFCDVMNKLQRGTFQEFEQARSEMSALCVSVDNRLKGAAMVKEAQEEIAYKAIAWCEAHDKVATVNNVVMALDNLGLLVEGNLTKREPDGESQA